MKNIMNTFLSTKENDATEDQRSADFEYAGGISNEHGRASALSYLADQGYLYFSSSDKEDYRAGMNSNR